MKINPSLDCAPVTDEERTHVNDLVTNALDSFNSGNLQEFAVSSRGVFVMMTLIKEQQDALFEINKSL